MAICLPYNQGDFIFENPTKPWRVSYIKLSSELIQWDLMKKKKEVE